MIYLDTSICNVFHFLQNNVHLSVCHEMSQKNIALNILRRQKQGMQLLHRVGN